MMGNLMALDRGRFGARTANASRSAQDLRFVFTPWVHWPETMGVFAEEDRILFPCDFLGAHLASTELYARDEGYRDGGQALLRRDHGADRPHAATRSPAWRSSRPAIVAPSHGPAHAEPKVIIDLYRRWTSDAVKPEVAIVYVSMYQSTAAMVEHLTDRLMEKGLAVRLFNAVDLDTGALAMALVDASTLVFASPTVLDLGRPQPRLRRDPGERAGAQNALRGDDRLVRLGHDHADALNETLREFKATFFDPVLTKGAPTSETFAELDALAELIAAANASLRWSERAAPGA